MSDPLTTPLPKKVRRSWANFKITDSIKSGLSRSVMWGSAEGFRLKVYNKPENKDLIDLMWDLQGEPGTTYFPKPPGVVAFQWLVKNPNARKIWRSATLAPHNYDPKTKDPDRPPNAIREVF